MAGRTLVRALIAMAAVLAFGLGMGASPAAAHAVVGSWSDNHTLARSGYTNSGNIVRLWQAIVWVGNTSLGSGFIDGQFGNNTHNQTVNWQLLRMGPNEDDGIVGPRTWTAAQRFCDDWTDGTYVYYRLNDWYRFPGSCSGRTFDLRERISTGEWSFRNPNGGAWTGTGH